MWYQIQETDFRKIRIGDLLLKQESPVRADMLTGDHNEFFIVEAMNDHFIKFKKAQIIKSSINYSYTSCVTEELFNKTYWYCFEKRYITY